MLKECDSLNEVHDSHLLQASKFSDTLSQFMVFARILAQVVFPTPLGPQNKNACAKCLFLIAFFKVFVMDACPITLSKVEGLYLRAETMKLSIIYSVKIRKIKDNIYLHLPNYYLSLHPLIRNNIAMRKDIHPENYRFVVFKDVSCDHTFMTRSTAASKETIKWTDGKEYPLIKLEISDKSHPFYTGKMKLVDTAGRVDKFKTRFTKVREEQATIREAKIEELRVAQSKAQEAAAAKREAEATAAEKQAEEEENNTTEEDTEVSDNVPTEEEGTTNEETPEEAKVEVAEEEAVEEVAAPESAVADASAEETNEEPSDEDTAEPSSVTEETTEEETPAEKETSEEEAPEAPKEKEEGSGDEETKK